MTRKTYQSAIEEVLRPEGFVLQVEPGRRNKTWRRDEGGSRDEVYLEHVQDLGVTISLSTVNLAAMEFLRDVAGTVGMVIPVHCRIDALIGGKSRWWKKDPNGPAEVAELIRTYALPFFEGEHDVGRQLTRFGRGREKWGGVVSRLYLAATLHLMGETQEACEALRNIPRTTPSSWKARVEQMRLRLGCPAD